ncbi:guanine nucleotide-binding protein subunit beta-like protein [Anaeramoeba flamelloides]|uniref:Mediator of RNA polymerase II transcription subunit 16 n=1 Tax=Anaeramoeba flamelloides TaxID=1746091 RepID=A0ABQ8YLZ2_9EUKA|nr:guanine nucleotide-binding protein subunit beta-like protein [Anaeramoeba flamelloides]
MSSLRPERILRGHRAPISSGKFLAYPFIATGSSDGVVKLWKTTSFKNISTIQAHPDSSLISLTSFNSGNSFLTQGRDSLVKTWDINQGSPQCSNVLTTNSLHSFCKLGLSKDNKIIAISGNDPNVLEFWDYTSQENIHSIKSTKNGMVMSVTFSDPNSNKICIGYENGMVNILDLRTYEAVSSRKNHSQPVLAVCMNTGGTIGVSCSADPEILKFSISETKIEIIDKFQANTPGFASLVLRSDEKILGSCGWDKRIRIFSFKRNLKQLAILKFHKETVNDLDFLIANEKELILSVSKDKRAAIWNVPFQKKK